jgi:hypothetical protein
MHRDNFTPFLPNTNTLKKLNVDENRMFESRWTLVYLVISIERAAACIVCNKNVCFNEYSIKRHYEMKLGGKHGWLSWNKIIQLQNRLAQQQSLLKFILYYQTVQCVLVEWFLKS